MNVTARCMKKSRREWRRHLFFANIMGLIVLTPFMLLAQEARPMQSIGSHAISKPKAVLEKLEWFRDQKLCLMMHFGLYSVLGITESWPLSTKDAFWARSDVEWTKDDTEFKRQYYALNRCFNPIRFNARDIAKTARQCGFRYVAFTTKHHDGFCLYDTKFTDYKTTALECPYSSNPNADIVKSLFDACRAEGLGISAYFSKADFHHNDYWEDFGISRFTTRYPTYNRAEFPEKWKRFKSFTKSQILELVGNYGPIDMLWLDGGWLLTETGWDLGIPDIIDAARKLQPNLISVDRMANTQYMDIKTPEQTVPFEPLDCPWETCITMSEEWGYHYDDQYKSPRELIDLLIDVVAKGGNLALNVGPMPDGRLPRPALERMSIIGRWLEKNGDAIYGTRTATPWKLGKWRFTMGKDGRLFAIRTWKGCETRMDHILLNFNCDNCEIKSVVHLATKKEIPFVRTEGDYEGGITLNFPNTFKRDEYADVFVVEIVNKKKGIKK